MHLTLLLSTYHRVKTHAHNIASFKETGAYHTSFPTVGIFCQLTMSFGIGAFRSHCASSSSKVYFPVRGLMNKPSLVCFNITICPALKCKDSRTGLGITKPMLLPKFLRTV